MVYDVASATIGPDGMIIAGAAWWDGQEGRVGPVLVEPDEPEYERWLWLMANKERFPEVNNDNAASVIEAFEKSRNL
jgi:hypothetical protein